MARNASTSRNPSFQASPGLRHDVRDHLRNQIFDGTLQPGDRIVESRLARELGISQAPVREALRELEQMGLVVSYPNRGSSVRKVEPTDAAEMYSLRAHLEAMAVDRAVERMTEGDLDTLDGFIDGMLDAAANNDPERLTELDTAFHEFILTCADHDLLLRTWQGISPLNWTMMTVIRLKDRNLTELAERHRPVVQALRARDVAAADAAIREHVMVLGDRVVRELENNASARQQQEED
ncbi:MAG TPA: GntR family transcriptional regulator [Thermomicrobiales bacterium]|nr:GntR family transcriptional regulator [Thermomicrobiales bacterium]